MNSGGGVMGLGSHNAHRRADEPPDGSGCRGDKPQKVFRGVYGLPGFRGAAMLMLNKPFRVGRRASESVFNN